MKKYTTEDLITELKKTYGDKYDYSKTIYYGSKRKFCITCPVHGDFYLRLDKVRLGYECPQCIVTKQRQKKLITFIEKAKEVHGDKYDYSKVEYERSDTKVCIICPEHGEFWQCPINHINGQGCKKCYSVKRTGCYDLTTAEVIEKAKEVHGDKYDYSKTEYKGLKRKMVIICPEHGEFEQVAYDHLRGFKCSKCKSDEDRLTVEQFIEKAREIHGEKYDYSKVEYVNNHTKVCIICPEHGEFLQCPSHHLLGCGCQKCHRSRMEKTIAVMLQNNNIKFIEQYKPKWIGRQSFDFYLPDYNIVIECQGLQHIKNIKKFGGNMQDMIERDTRKKQLCIENSLNMVYIIQTKYVDDFLHVSNIYNNDNVLSIKNVYHYDENFEKKFFQKIFCFSK